MASGSTPDDLPKVETENQPHAQAHEQVQDQQQSQTKVQSEVQSKEDPQRQLEAQAEALPHPQLHAQQVQEHSQPKVQPTDEPQVQSQDQPKDTLQVKPRDQQKDQEKARLHHQNKEQQTDQQDAQPQANSQAQPSSKTHAQQQVLVAPTPVVKEKTFGVAVLEILAIAIAIALFFVVLAVVFKRHRSVAVAGSDRTMCPSTACDRLAGALISSLQRESNPCDDFYAYVCGRYTGMHSTGDVFSDMEAELWRLVKDKVVTGADFTYALPTVTTTPPPSHPSIFNKVQALFAACLRPPVNDSTAPLKAFVDSQGLGFPGSASTTDAVLTMLRLSYLYDVQSVLGAHFLAFKPQPRNLLLRASVNRRYVQWLEEKPQNVSFSYHVLLDVYDRVEHVDEVVQRVIDTEKVVRRLANAAVKGNATPLEFIMEDKDIRYYGNGAVTTLLSNLRSSLPAETLHLLVSWDTVRTMAPLVSPATVPGEGGTRYSRCWRLVQRSLGVRERAS
ncbi:hypothetical protein HPB50_005854 [Hyalomma asiaticum]|uniref:Uncharacterized protein n=1 Tax=Hyalomma asiaticum TaxID=266040 RepID=A0ACB7S9D0_HYAAI|nr:hypothetical protein HPB50_005854 [Hyalomma asiaticum]